MKIFLDTASVSEIKEGVALGVVDGVTTNPSLIAKEKRPFRPLVEEICSIVSGDVSLEVVATDFEGMVKEGQELAQVAPNAVVKCPLTKDGLKAVKYLSGKGIRVNQTLCFSATQALLSAKAGAVYISPFLGLYFGSKATSWPRPALADVGISAGLGLVFAPLYLIALYEWPVQVNSDEVVVSEVAREYGAMQGVDPFGISNYLGRPAGLFVLWGNLAERLGPANDWFYNVRLLQALFGLLTIAVAFAFFRQLLPRWWAVFATALLGVNHAFLMISRMSMRENTSVLVEVAAFALLFWGLRNEHALLTFLGGFAARLGFSVCVPGRAVSPVWVLFLVLLAFLFRDQFPLRRLAQTGAIALAGFILMAGPVMIAESKIPPETTPQRDVLFIYPEARQLQQGWVFANSQ